jgi:hypothetical protein
LLEDLRAFRAAGKPRFHVADTVRCDDSGHGQSPLVDCIDVM